MSATAKRGRCDRLEHFVVVLEKKNGIHLYIGGRTLAITRAMYGGIHADTPHVHIGNLLAAAHRRVAAGYVLHQAAPDMLVKSGCFTVSPVPASGNRSALVVPLTMFGL